MSVLKKNGVDLIINDKSSIINELRNAEYDDVDVDLLYDVMEIPSYSGYETEMSKFIREWADANGIKSVIDDMGNVYLTKGVVSEGEYYPCVTSHMDTVQENAKRYVLSKERIPLYLKINGIYHELHAEGQGIGADDKLGVFICLSLMLRFDKIKAVFFVEEEVGMLGSDKLDRKFFDDVAYVIGWDSPELYRSAWKTSGVRLFTYDFYMNKLKPIISEWGFINGHFMSETYTDVLNIKNKTGIMCMNFGNGGYDAHTLNEFLVVEDTDQAVAMGADIIDRLGNKERFKEDVPSEKPLNEKNMLLEASESAKLSRIFEGSELYGQKSDIMNDTVIGIIYYYENYIKSLKESVKDLYEKRLKDIKCTETLELSAVIEELFDKVKKECNEKYKDFKL